MPMYVPAKPYIYNQTIPIDHALVVSGVASFMASDNHGTPTGVGAEPSLLQGNNGGDNQGGGTGNLDLPPRQDARV